MGFGVLALGFGLIVTVIVLWSRWPRLHRAARLARARGQSLVEYGLIVALVGVVLIASLKLFGQAWTRLPGFGDSCPRSRTGALTETLLAGTPP